MFLYLTILKNLMSVSVITISEEPSSQNFKNGKKRSCEEVLSKSIEDLNLKKAPLIEEVTTSYKLEDTFKLDFQFNTLSLPKINSKRLKKDIRIQLNMDYETYEYLNYLFSHFINSDKNLKWKDVKRLMKIKLKKKINIWAETISIETKKGIKFSKNFVRSKADYLLNEFIEFKKDLSYHSQNS